MKVFKTLKLTIQKKYDLFEKLISSLKFKSPQTKFTMVLETRKFESSIDLKKRMDFFCLKSCH